MKKLCLTMIGTALLAAGPSWAIQVTVSELVPGYAGPNAGELNVSVGPSGGVTGTGYDSKVLVLNASGNLGFETFCIERNETLPVLPGQYNAVVNQQGLAFNGGSGGPSPDPISKGTAWLYDQFTRGVLADYNYTPGAGRAATAWALQVAIWILEDEYSQTLIIDGSNKFLDQVVAQFGGTTDYEDLTAAKADNNAGYPIGVLNMTTVAGAKAQDVLTRLPDGGASLLLLGMSLLGLGAFRRNRA